MAGGNARARARYFRGADTRGIFLFPPFLFLFFSNLLLFDARDTYAPSYLSTHTHFVVARYTLFALYYLSPSKFCALFSKTLQLITTTSSSTTFPSPRRHPLATQPPAPASQTSHQPSCYFPVHHHRGPLLPPRAGTYSIDRSARPCHGLSTVDPRYLVGFRGSYVDTLGMFVEEAGAAGQQQHQQQHPIARQRRDFEANFVETRKTGRRKAGAARAANSRRAADLFSCRRGPCVRSFVRSFYPLCLFRFAFSFPSPVPPPYFGVLLVA